MNDYKKITEGYEAVAPGKAATLASAAAAQAEIFGWLFAKLIKSGQSTEEEIEGFLKELRSRSPDPAQSAIYDLALDRMFAHARTD